MGRSRPGSNDYEEVFPKGPGLETHYQTQFRVVARTLVGGEGCYPSAEMLVKLATVVEGDSKAPFSITTSLWYYSFPCIDSLYPVYIPYNAEY